jgi:hypothetical protein
VLSKSTPTRVPISVTAETFLRRSSLEAIQSGGRLGQLIARQAIEFAADEKMEEIYGEVCEQVPADLLNFQHDPLACAIALGFNAGVEIQELPLVIEEQGGFLRERLDDQGRRYPVVTQVDGALFEKFWVEKIAGR